MVGLHVVTPRDRRHGYPRLKRLRDNPSLHIVRPATVAPSETHNLATPDKPIPAISHAEILLKHQKKNRPAPDARKPQISMGRRRRIQRSIVEDDLDLARIAILVPDLCEALGGIQIQLASVAAVLAKARALIAEVSEGHAEAIAADA